MAGEARRVWSVVQIDIHMLGVWQSDILGFGVSAAVLLVTYMHSKYVFTYVLSYSDVLVHLSTRTLCTSPRMLNANSTRSWHATLTMHVPGGMACEPKLPARRLLPAASALLEA